MIHTHPDDDPSFFQGPTIYNSGVDDFTSLEEIGGKAFPGEIFGYVISTNEVYMYYFDQYGNKVSVPIGSRTDLSDCQ